MTYSTKRFDDHFEVILADTPESRNIHFQLRYQVYCEELGFEDKHRFPDGMEYDEWDAQAVHFIVRHRMSGKWLGAVRLAHHRQYQFPFETKCMPFTALGIEHYRDSIELSRMCVIKNHTQIKRLIHHIDTQQPDNIRHLSQYQSIHGLLMWGLIKAAASYCHKNGLRHCYILVAPSLANVLRKAKFKMTQIGHPCEHRGQRTPYRLSVDHVLSNTLWELDYQKEYLKDSDITTNNTLSTKQPDYRMSDVIRQL